MLKNYFLITVRNLSREKAYIIINILGLALAMACALILLLYIRSELSYDQHFDKHDRIVRITYESKAQGETRLFGVSSVALKPLFEKEYPELAELVRFRNNGRALLIANNIESYWDDMYMADPNVFKIFSHRAVYGDLDTALDDPSSIVISQKLAQQYFGNSNPIGETMSTDTFDFRVSAVFADPPDNTHLKYNALISLELMESFGQNDEEATFNQLFRVGVYTYALLAPDVQQDTLQQALDDFRDNHMLALIEPRGMYATYYTQALKDVHFDSSPLGNLPTGNIFYVYGFIAVALFILMVACINYTNLAIARAVRRSKEVGMRKVIGANRTQLIVQFLAESCSYTFIALLLGLMAVELAERLTPLPSLLNKTSLLVLAGQESVLAWLLVGTFAIGLFAGAYPAFYLSSISPLGAIKATKKIGHSGWGLRQILIFIQFFISIAVVASTILMGLQMEYVRSKPLGIEKENKLIIQLRGLETLEKIPLIRNELLSNSNILGVTETSYTLENGGRWAVNILDVETNEGGYELTRLNHIATSNDFVEVMGIDIVEGRDFSKKLLTDVGTSIIVNETLVKQLGWEQPLGKKIRNFDATVVGVMRDFHFQSLHQPIGAMFIRPYPSNDLQGIPPAQANIISRTVIISIVNEDIYETINYIESVMNRFDPKHPFEFRFYDDMVNLLYINEVNLMKLTGIFSAICIFISCLGLFGLSAFTTQQRTKEIGIRKVLGADTSQIILLLAKNQLVLIVVASVLASTASYYIISEWLTAFAYRTDINLWVFLFSSIIVALLAFLTIALQSGKTAQANPVIALKHE